MAQTRLVQEAGQIKDRLQVSKLRECNAVHHRHNHNAVSPHYEHRDCLTEARIIRRLASSSSHTRLRRFDALVLSHEIEVSEIFMPHSPRPPQK